MAIDDSDTDDTQGTDGSRSSSVSETTELEAENDEHKALVQHETETCRVIVFVVRFSYCCSSLPDERCPCSLVHVVAANDPGHREGLHRLALQSIYGK